MAEFKGFDEEMKNPYELVRPKIEKFVLKFRITTRPYELGILERVWSEPNEEDTGKNKRPYEPVCTEGERFVSRDRKTSSPYEPVGLKRVFGGKE